MKTQNFLIPKTSHLYYLNTGEVFIFLIEKCKRIYYKIITKEAILFKKSKEILSLKSKYCLSEINVLVRFFDIFRARYKKTLLFKGLGLKIRFINNKTSVELKLGYSHVCNIFINKEIKFKIKKKKFSISSFNKESLGNFIFQIRLKKKPNIYTGKGIWLRNEKLKLKAVRKTKQLKRKK
jgi:large subunit ribosomal protein L6